MSWFCCLPLLLFERYSAIKTLFSQLHPASRGFKNLPLILVFWNVKMWWNGSISYKYLHTHTHTHTHTHIRDKDSFCVGNLMYPFSLKAHVLQFRGIALYYSFCVISFLSCSLFSHSESPLIQLWILLYLSSNFLWAPSLFFCLFKFWGFFQL